MRKKAEQRGRRLLHFLLALAMALGLCQPVLVPAEVTTRYAVDTVDETAVVDQTNETDTTETEDDIVSEDVSEDTGNPEEIDDSEYSADSAEDQAEGAVDSAETDTKGAADSVEGEADSADEEAEGATDSVEGSADTTEGAADSVEDDEENASDGSDTAALSLSLKGISTEGSSGSYVIASFDNTYAELVRVAGKGVKITGTADDSTRDLTYNSNQTSHISYANAGEFIVSGTTISFYTSSLYEGENTVTFCNPDEGGTDLTVRLKMEREDEGWGRYSYTVTVLENDPPADNPPAVDPPQEPEALSLSLQGISADGSSGSYIIASFDNTYAELVRVAGKGVKITGTADDSTRDLTYNSNQTSHISYANAGEFIVSGTTISFYTSSLYEGENTVTFCNPDEGGTDLTVRLKMEREDEGWGRYSYTVTVLENDPPADDPPAVDPPQEPEALSLSLQGISTEGTSGSYVNASFDNTYAELVRVANAGVKITGTADDSTRDLTFNSNQTSHISYANAGEFIVSGTTISFYTSSLYEGENTVTFCNPDEGGTDLVVRLKMEREDEGWGRYSYTVTVLENDPPADDPPQEPDPTQDVLFVRLTGSFEHRIVGQEDPAPDSISSASVGGYTAADSEATVHVEYALAPAGTEQDDLADDAWKQPDYFTNGNEFQIDGTRSVVQMTEGSGMSCDLNQLNGDLTLTGVPTQAGVYKVSVLVIDALGRSALTNEVEFIVYSGNETLQAQLSDDSLFVQYQDGTRGFDMIPWYIHDFGTSDQSVTVPSDIKVWYGSHGENPTPNYGELGETISLANGETPSQTLILPAGSNLTMVNLRVHSGVKIVVEKGAKLTLRSSIAEGIVDVYGTFSCDYSDYDKTWLHGSSVNGQIRMMDGSTLENARVISHANYSGRDDENRRNFAPLITVQGSVTVAGDVYILGDEAPTGETGQPALSITDGSLTVPEGSVAAAYGGGTSFLTADGGSAIVMDKGSILGEGSLIAVGGFGMNITGDTSKGSGGSAVSGDGTIAVSKAYLEGGSSFQRPAKALSGSVAISETTSRKIVDGSAEQGNTYWKGTGDANGITPDTQAVLALVPARVQAANPAGQRSISVSVDWQSANWPESVEKPQTINAVIKDKSGTPAATIALDAGNSWTKIISGLTDTEEYTVECSGLPDDCTVTQDSTDSTKWAPEQAGYLAAGKTYLITWEDNGQLFVLGAQEGVLGRAAWDGAAELPAGFQWKAIESEDRSGWYLTLAGDDQTGNAPFLTMTQDGTGAPTLRERNGADAYCALFAKEDGSLWNENAGRYFVIEKGNLTTSDQTFTAFTFRQKLEQTDRFILSPKAPAQDPSSENKENQDPSSPGNKENQDPSSSGNKENQDPSSPGNKEDQPTGSEKNRDQKQSIENASMEGVTEKTYTGSPLTQDPSIRLGGITLISGTDYVLSYKNNTDAGTASVTATGCGNYTGSLTKTFIINKSGQPLAIQAGKNLTVGNTLTVKGSGNKTALSFKSSNTKIASVNKKGLVTGKAPGTVTITVTAPGNKNYDSASRSVKIKVKYLSTPKISKVINVRGGIKITLSGVKGAKKYRILYKTAGKGWKKAGDTTSKTFTWKKAKSGTKYTFTVQCVTKDGKLAASKYNTKGMSLTCMAAPGKPSVANKKAGTVNASWKKIKGANGYQIQYSVKKSFPSGRKTITVEGADKTSSNISSLSKGKTYFFRVRSYKNVSGKRTYSAWSLVNSAKIVK